MEQVVYLKKSRRDIQAILRQVPAACAGNVPQANSAMRALLLRVGMTALFKIRQAFVVKARGGTDECGLSWKPLSPATIAYSRRHPGVLWPGKKRAPFRPSWMLTDAQRKRWWQLNAIGGPAYAWTIVKQEGGKTLIGEYGNTPVDILRDTGLLLNSLSPGIGTNHPNQIFQIGNGDVIVGTNRKWASVHHNGIRGKIPKRRLWADPRNWTPDWWSDIVQQAKEGLLEITLFMIGR
jgi:hypothetical protein